MKVDSISSESLKPVKKIDEKEFSFVEKIVEAKNMRDLSLKFSIMDNINDLDE